MNALPAHRRLLNGRTHSSPWRAEDYDPIQRFTRPISPAERIYGVVLATVLGIVGAAALVHWWSA